MSSNSYFIQKYRLFSYTLLGDSMNKLKSILLNSCILFFILMLFKNTKEVLESVIKGIDIWKNNIVPALFPFFIISHIMIDFGFVHLFKEILKPILSLFKTNSNASFVLAMSLLSGSPSNAKYTKELYLRGDLNKEEAEKTLTFTFFSSPLFILGTLSCLYLKNMKVGILILIIHIFSNFIIGILFRNYGTYRQNENINIKKGFKDMLLEQKNKKIMVVIVKSIKESLSTCFLILGSIIFIYVVTSTLSDLIPTNTYINATIKGVLEVTQGLLETSLLDIPMRFKGTLSIMLLSFGGISIYIQIISILSDTDLSTFPYICARILHSAISGILFFFFYPFI